MEQDGRGVGGLEVHLLHEYIRNTPSDIEVHGKQEYLTSENEYIEYYIALVFFCVSSKSIAASLPPQRQ